MHLPRPFIFILLTIVLGCGTRTPNQPSSASLVGSWSGTVTGRTPCAGDWTAVELTLDSLGKGELVTRDGQHFTALLVTGTEPPRIDITVPPGSGECSMVSLVVAEVTGHETQGASAFVGNLVGRCCGTVQAQFDFRRR